METHSAATRASSKLKPEKAKSPAAPKCGGMKDIAETATIVKGTADKKEAANAVVEVSKVPNITEIASKLKLRKRAPTSVKTTVNTDKKAVSISTTASKNNFEDATTAVKTTKKDDASTTANSKKNLEDDTNTVESTAVETVKKYDTSTTADSKRNLEDAANTVEVLLSKLLKIMMPPLLLILKRT